MAEVHLRRPITLYRAWCGVAEHDGSELVYDSTEATCGMCLAHYQADVRGEVLPRPDVMHHTTDTSEDNS